MAPAQAPLPAVPGPAAADAADPALLMVIAAVARLRTRAALSQYCRDRDHARHTEAIRAIHEDVARWRQNPPKETA